MSDARGEIMDQVYQIQKGTDGWIVGYFSSSQKRFINIDGKRVYQSEVRAQRRAAQLNKRYERVPGNER